MAPDAGAENAPVVAEQSAEDVLGLGVDSPVAPATVETAPAPAQPAAPATAAPVAEQPTPWTPEELAQYPGLAKFKDRDAALKSLFGLERTFHGFHQAQLDPDTVLRALTTERGEGGEGQATDEETAPAETVADPLDEATPFLDDFASNPRARVRAEARSVVHEELRRYATAQTVSKAAFDEAVKDPAMPEFEQRNDEMVALLQQHPDLLAKHAPGEVMRLLYRMAGGAAAPSKAKVDQIKEDARSEMRDTILESGRVGSVSPGTGARGTAAIADDILAGSGAAQPVLRPA